MSWHCLLVSFISNVKSAVNLTVVPLYVGSVIVLAVLGCDKDVIAYSV